ncbi:MAG: hypothetical protein NT166_06260 [Candidatus Aminicenantes bacterium]|nr:hypothetical protein [Candidatus Aminicenantes bacterium]
MKNRYLANLLFLAMGIILTYHGYGTDEVDAVSRATRGWQWPPFGYTYQVTVVPGIDGYVIVYNDNLYRGGALSPEAAGQLKNFGVKTVITIDPDPKLEKTVKAAGLKPVTFTWKNRGIMPQEDLERFLELIKKNEAPFYLHSKEENQEAGILAAIYRVHVENWPYEKTIIEYGRVGGSLKDDDRLLRAIMKKEQ